MAPELVRRHHEGFKGVKNKSGPVAPTTAIDMWAMGTCLYKLLSGYEAFKELGKVEKLLEAISNLKYDFKRQVWQTVSEEAKDLIRALLVRPHAIGSQCPVLLTGCQYGGSRWQQAC